MNCWPEPRTFPSPHLENNDDSYSRTALGRTLQEPGPGQSRPLRHRRGAGGGRAGPTAGWSSATCVSPNVPATCCAKSPSPSCCKMMKKAGDLYTKAELPLRRRHADARPVRPHAVGHHRPARAHVPVQHGEKPLRAQPTWTSILDSPDPRPRPEHPVPRLRRRVARRAGQLPGAVARAGHGAAEQLARRSHAVAADHPDADRPGAEARPAGTVDAVPHDRRPSSRPACPSRPSPSIPASATSAPPCWPAARAA